MRIARKEVEKMSIEELASRLKALGWEADFNSIVDGVPTVFEKTLNVNDYEGVGDLMDTTEELTANPDIIEDPYFLTYRIDLQEKSAEYYFYGVDDNPNNSGILEDFYKNELSFAIVMTYILNGEFFVEKQVPFADVWQVVYKTDDGNGGIPNVYFSLAQATYISYWEGYVLDAAESTTVEAGDYAIIVEENRENSPKFYYLITREEANQIMNAESNIIALDIMEEIVRKKIDGNN